jgi:maleylacetoacetate isomerase
MHSKLKLYSYFRSSSAYRVRIALNIKSLPYDTIPIHLLKNGGEQFSAEYAKRNPSKQVPCLIDGNLTLGQSMAILEYLEEEFPHPALLPRVRGERALIRQMCETINSGMQPYQNLSTTLFLTKNLGLSDEQKMQWLNHWLTAGFESLEALLQKYSGDYCFGNSITLADCLLVPQVFSAQRLKVDLTKYEKVLDINKRCLQLTDFIKAGPEKQPDYEP